MFFTKQVDELGLIGVHGMGDVVPVMALLRSLVYLLASLCMTVFFYVFSRAQPR